MAAGMLGFHPSMSSTLWGLDLIYTSSNKRHVTLADRWFLSLPANSRQSIKKYVQANNTINVASTAAFDAHFNKAIKDGVTKGDFTQPKGML